MANRLIVSLLVLTIFFFLETPTPGPVILDSESAEAVFHEAAVLSEKDAGGLWGVELYGPMLLIDPSTRRVIANEQDSAAILEQDGDVYVGTWPEESGVANTATDWSGKKWTMLAWPLPENGYDRRALIAHELWHRVQEDVGLPMQGGPTTHLGGRDGRVYIQLEWRALAVALRFTEGAGDYGSPHEQAVLDALAFRAYRRSLFPDGVNTERALEMHEGLAQYTGFALSGRSSRLNREKAAWDLKRAESNATFVRSFAYASGPAYGLLLDQAGSGDSPHDLSRRTQRRATDATSNGNGKLASWRGDLGPDADLGKILAMAYDVTLPEDLEEYVAAASTRYNGAELAEKEDLIEAERQARLDDMRRKFVTGPVLELPFFKMQVQFDPGKIYSLDDLGNVYLSLRLSDQWGILTATDGALITKGWKMVVVPAPEEHEGTRIKGEGYVLDLKEEWELRELEGREGFSVKRQ